MTPSDAYVEYASGDILTDYLEPNEPFESFWQGPVMRGPGKGRWRVYVWVIRNDKVAKFIQDVADATLFAHVPQEFIPGDGETTVSEVLHEAERFRSDTKWANEHIARLKEESTLFSDVQENWQKRQALIRNRTIIGPYFQYQRNGYSSVKTWRDWFDERARRTGRTKSVRGQTR